MAKKTKKDQVNQKELFINAILLLEKQGISRETTVQALKEAFESIIKKKNNEDLVVKIDILVDEGIINIFNVREIVENVDDDALQVTKETADEEVASKNGAFIDSENRLNSPVNISDFNHTDINKFKNILKQKMNEAEKANIYAAYSDKVGEIVSGYVESVEPNMTKINLGRTTVVLSDRCKIGNEEFKVNDVVKVYLSEVNSSSKGPQILVSRTDKNFLKRIFEEEIHEIFTGEVVIEDIAREAGLRSKVSVSTTNINIDPVGACIGQGGSKIQKICSQINHEKIDIIQHHVYEPLFIAEALKPAQVLGVSLVEGEEKKAIAVIKDGDTRVAIGTRGVNVRLASKLTHYSIDVKEESVAKEENIVYETLEQLKAKEEQVIFEKRREEILKQNAKEEEERKLRLQEELNAISEEIVEEEVKEEENVQEPVVEEKVQEEVVAPSQEEVVEQVEYKPVVMGEKISLSELEKQIEEEKKKNVNKPQVRKAKKEEEEVEEQVEEIRPSTKYMDIYTDEELEELEDEYEDEYEDDEDEIDYSEYDKYYEDN